MKWVTLVNLNFPLDIFPLAFHSLVDETRLLLVQKTLKLLHRLFSKHFKSLSFLNLFIIPFYKQYLSWCQVLVLEYMFLRTNLNIKHVHGLLIFLVVLTNICWPGNTNAKCFHITHQALIIKAVHDDNLSHWSYWYIFMFCLIEHKWQNCYFWQIFSM